MLTKFLASEQAEARFLVDQPSFHRQPLVCGACTAIHQICMSWFHQFGSYADGATECQVSLRLLEEAEAQDLKLGNLKNGDLQDGKLFVWGP